MSKVINIKIAIVCSPGGHFTEMSTLIDVFKGYEAFLVTHSEKFNIGLDNVCPTYLIPNIIIDNTHRNVFSKKLLLIIHMLIITFYEAYIFLKERPNIVISTGSEIAIPIFIIGTIFRVHTVYIESITRINDISATGKIIYCFADLFLVQHEKLLGMYPNAKYRGSVI